eukprot:2694668-Amphidinium_carterae.1
MPRIPFARVHDSGNTYRGSCHGNVLSAVPLHVHVLFALESSLKAWQYKRQSNAVLKVATQQAHVRYVHTTVTTTR